MTTLIKSDDALLKTNSFTKEAVNALAEKLNEPKWLAEKRQAAWQIFTDTPMPTTSDEPWRRTSLKKIKWDKFELNVNPSIAKANTLANLPENVQELFDKDRMAAGRLLIVNGQVQYYEFSPNLATQGVIFTDLQSAIQNHADLVQPHLMAECVPPSDSKFAAMNAALWENGSFLYIPQDVTVKDPFQVVLLIDGPGATHVHRTLIVAEANAQATYIEETASVNNADLGLNVGVVEIISQPGSEVRYADVQQLGQKVYNFNTKRALAYEDSDVIWDIGALGSALTKTFLDTQLIGNGANTECNGVYFLDNRQHIDIDTLMHHRGYSTTGDLLIHGALRDKARSVFIGLIKIDPTGQLTNSYLKNQNLLLANTARADSIPCLEIDANDVRASHAATISQVEEEYIFYLQSRGIPRNIAVQMIVEGFFSTIFNRMGNERVRERLLEAVTKKMDGLQ